MKTLILIRHAKSEHPFEVRDFERPLSLRGVDDAKMVAGASPEPFSENPTIWASSARRARDTASIFTEVHNIRSSEVLLKDDLYTFSSADLTKIIRTCDDTANLLIVFGHNEAITDFVNKFGDIFIDNVPTSGFVTLTFAASKWKDISRGKTGRCIFPKDLHI